MMDRYCKIYMLLNDILFTEIKKGVYFVVSTKSQ